MLSLCLRGVGHSVHGKGFAGLFLKDWGHEIKRKQATVRLRRDLGSGSSPGYGGGMAKRFSERQRAALLAKFERRDGSAAAFCRRHGVSSQTLRVWRRAKSKGRQSAQPMEFVEVELRPQDPKDGGSHANPACQGDLSRRSAAKTEAQRRPVAELDLGAGVVLRLFPRGGGRS